MTPDRRSRILKVRRQEEALSDSSGETLTPKPFMRSGIIKREALDHPLLDAPLETSPDERPKRKKRILKAFEVAALSVSSKSEESALIEESSRLAELEQLKEETERLKAELEEKLKQAEEELRRAQEQASQIIAQAQEQAQKVLTEAQEQARQLAEQVAQQAYQEAFTKGQQEGYQAGYQEGYQKGFSETARAALLFKEELKKLLTARRQLLESFRSQLLTLAFEMAKAIVEREIKLDETIVWNSIVANIDKIKGRDEVTIRVNPEDLDYVRTKKEELKAMIEDIKSINVLPDPQIDRGGCVIETSLGTIDARISVKLEALRELVEHLRSE